MNTLRWIPIAILLSLFFAVSCSSDSASKEDTTESDGDTTLDTVGDTSDTDVAPDVDVTDTSDSSDQTDVSTDTTDVADVADATDTADMAAGPCPAGAPADTDACDRVGLVCEYEDDIRRDCRTRAECTATGWSVPDPGCDPLPMAMCPATRDDAAGELCDPIDSFCDYDGLICECTNCREFPVGGCSGPIMWQCEAPIADMECPRSRPRLGDACTTDAKKCEYECGDTGATVCQGGVWVETTSFGCPISTRLVKDQIDYLSPVERGAVATAVMDMRLATWKYTDPALTSGEHLGFIIEDVPADSPAVDNNKPMVDLYGYTSMLVAATQEQQETIEAMRKELDVLRTEVEALRDQTCP